jgi:4-diphosphocytidyl-2-C-methyl-D-erythritol kinase
MSGSGATCFGIFPDEDTAGKAALSIREAKPGWWTRPTTLT